jgi:hypothetical protein
MKPERCGMAKATRKLDDGKYSLADKLLNGDYKKLLEHIIGDEELRLEIRRENKVFIYYKKNKILEIGFNSLKVDKQWKTLPKTKDKPKGEQTCPDPKKYAKDKPEYYFSEMKKCITNFRKRKAEPEYETQQKIASANNDSNSKYIIIDMEYCPSQEKENLKIGDIIYEMVYKKDDDGKNVKNKKGNNIKLTPNFDLLGIEKETGNIILFEVKKGIKAVDKKPGIKEHLKDFKACFKENKKLFTNILKKDIEGIIDAKVKLGILKQPEKLNYSDVEFMFIFDPSEDKKQKDEETYFKDKFKERVKKDEWKYYPTIFVNSKDYTLSEDKSWTANGE